MGLDDNTANMILLDLLEVSQENGLQLGLAGQEIPAPQERHQEQVASRVHGSSHHQWRTSISIFLLLHQLGNERPQNILQSFPRPAQTNPACGENIY